MSKTNPFNKPSEAWVNAVKDDFKNQTDMNTQEIIELEITSHVGNLVRYDYYNDGSRGLLTTPYRPKYKHAKFRLPSGKPKCEVFSDTDNEETILKVIGRKYSNFKFTTTQTQNK